jgi:hypothetical protein
VVFHDVADGVAVPHFALATETSGR